MATVREGVMKKEIFNANHQGEIKMIDVNQFTTPEDFVIHVIERHMEKSKVNLKAAPIIVAGGYGVGSKENFQLLHELATVLGGEVGASRAAVDAGFCEHERQSGQTGTTVRPKPVSYTHLDVYKRQPSLRAPHCRTLSFRPGL